MGRPKNSLNIIHRFSAKPWKYDSHDGWVFMTLPADLSTEIRATFNALEEGWGRLPVTA